MNPARTFKLAALLAAALLCTAGYAAEANADGRPASGAPGRAALDKLCSSCAIVRSVVAETRKGRSSGLGMVGGGSGALAGQVGSGSGKTVATFGGPIGGGLLGNDVDKHLKKSTVWVTTVTLKDGSLRRYEAALDPRLRPGDVVTAISGQLRKAP